MLIANMPLNLEMHSIPHFRKAAGIISLSEFVLKLKPLSSSSFLTSLKLYISPLKIEIIWLFLIGWFPFCKSNIESLLKAKETC
jgi:hypothetical protein